MDRPPNDPLQEVPKKDQTPTASAETPAATSAVPQPATTTPQKLGSGPNRAGRRVLVLYNCDYDAPVNEVADPQCYEKDRSAVALAANQVRDAIEAYGYEALISGVFGHDLADCLAH